MLSPIGMWAPSAAPTATVSPVSTNVLTSRTGGCYAMVYYHSNGVEYNNPTSGAQNGTNDPTAVSRGNWLDSGNAADVYIELTINSGTALTNNPASGGRVLCSSNPLFYNYTTSGFKNNNITVSFYTTVTGGTPLGSATFNLNANGGL